MSDQIMKKVHAAYLKTNLPDINIGDTVKVSLRIIEAEKARTQIFQGIIIGRRGSGTDKTITVRKMAAGNIGVERVFPLHAPAVEKIEIIRRGKVRRAKLTYLRGKSGKSAKVKELRIAKPESE